MTEILFKGHKIASHSSLTHLCPVAVSRLTNWTSPSFQQRGSDSISCYHFISVSGENTHANSTDPDQTPRDAVSDMGGHCLSTYGTRRIYGIRCLSCQGGEENMDLYTHT